MNSPAEVFGVLLLAAGASRRMGACKLLLPWEEGTILSHVLQQWRTLGAAQMVPVINPTNEPLRKALEDQEFVSQDWVENPNPERGMFSSVQEASRWEKWRTDLTHVILTLGDQPQIRTSTLQILLEAMRNNPHHICQPEFEGHTAHPIAMPMKIFMELAQTDASDLRAFIRLHESARLHVKVEDAGIIADLDTPDDYTRWKR